MSMISVVRPGPLAAVQDAGRHGHIAFGCRECGACDMYSYEIANIIAGNAGDEAAIELTLGGAELLFTKPAVIAFAGADMPLSIDGRAVPSYAPLYVDAGETLMVGFALSGLRGYLAVYGGIDVPRVMGSRSTDTACRLGGYMGRKLEKGDELPTGDADARSRRAWLDSRGLLNSACDASLCRPPHPMRYRGDVSYPLLRAVIGPQDGMFTAEGLDTFTSAEYRLSAGCDRMGCRLDGSAIELKGGADIISDGIMTGSVQVSANGLPIVMLADHQTTGGYAKIATVISADVPVIAQLRPGDSVGFRFVSAKDAALAARYESGLIRSVRGIYI